MTAPAPSITLAPDAEDNGLASMIAGLIEQNLQDHPLKRRDFARLQGRVCLIADDADVSLTLVFERGRLTVQNGIVGMPQLVVRATSDDIIQMSLIELTGRWALPDPRKPVMRQIVEGVRSGRICVWGGLRYLPLALRLTRVMSVN